MTESVVFGEQDIGEVGAEKADRARNQDAHFLQTCTAPSALIFRPEGSAAKSSTA
jgi:hypothetical protein